MTIARLLILVGALAAVGFAAKLALSGGSAQPEAAVSAPKRQLDDVRAKAKQLEVDQQHAADRADVAE
jgi:Flp pilus assembly protein CpaB